MNKSTYKRLWGYQSQLEEGLYEFTDNEHSNFCEKVTNDIQGAYDNQDVSKEQAEELCTAIGLEIEY